MIDPRESAESAESAESEQEAERRFHLVHCRSCGGEGGDRDTGIVCSVCRGAGEYDPEEYAGYCDRMGEAAFEARQDAREGRSIARLQALDLW